MASAFHLSPRVGLLHSMTATGMPVHEDRHVRDDLLLAADRAVLAGDDQLVLVGVVEVDEANRLPFLAVA
jgi:hypothetical protein